MTPCGVPDSYSCRFLAEDMGMSVETAMLLAAGWYLSGVRLEPAGATFFNIDAGVRLI